MTGNIFVMLIYYSECLAKEGERKT